MPTSDPFHLQRFVDAQVTAYTQARSEPRRRPEAFSLDVVHLSPDTRSRLLSDGQRYAITNLAEARAYLAHPLLGLRLRECTTLVNGFQHRSLEDILGYPDNLKFHSSMTLFGKASDAEESVFQAALTKWFNGEPDQATLKLVDR